MRTGLIANVLGTPLSILFLASAASAAPCVHPPLSTQAINDFKSNPKGIVAPDTDTRTIEAFVRDLVGTDASLAPNLVQLAKGTTPRFRSAIAAGLAQGAIACSTVDQNAALQIQQAVAGFQDGEFQNAFAAVAGDLSTAAAEAAVASADGAVGSVVVTNPNGSHGTSTNPGGGGTSVFFQIVPTSITINPINDKSAASGTTTAASPVSATR